MGRKFKIKIIFIYMEIVYIVLLLGCLFGGTVVKRKSICQCRRHGLYPWVRKILGSRKWWPTPVFLPGKFRGLQSTRAVVSRLPKSSDNYPSAGQVNSAICKKWVTILRLTVWACSVISDSGLNVPSCVHR